MPASRTRPIRWRRRMVRAGLGFEQKPLELVIVQEPPRVHTQARSVDTSASIERKRTVPWRWVTTASAKAGLGAQGPAERQHRPGRRARERHRRQACRTAARALRRAPRSPANCRPNRTPPRRAASGAQHALHLCKGAGPVVEEHHGELAGDGVEACVGERERFGAAVLPVDPRVLAPRDGQHLGIRVESGDGSIGPGHSGRRERQRAGAAAHVEHALSRRYSGGVANDRAPLAKQRGHELFIVDIGGRTRGRSDLPAWTWFMARLPRWAGLVSNGQ